MRKLLLSLQSGSLSKSLPTHSVDIGDSGPVRLGSEIDENQLPPPSPVHFVCILSINPLLCIHHVTPYSETPL